MLARPRTLPTGFIAPCLPTNAHTLPSGGLWLHEIKHDGFRIIARKDGPRVRLYSRPGNDFTRRFPLIVETLESIHERDRLARHKHRYRVSARDRIAAQQRQR
jgi:ATP-dependent DNA ligase